VLYSEGEIKCSGLKHEQAKVDCLGAEELVAVARRDVKSNVVCFGFVRAKLECVHARRDVHLAEGSLEHAELHVEARLRAAQLRLQNELVADVAIQRQVRVLFVVVDAGLEHPLVEEGVEAIRFEVELGCYVVCFVLFEL
jgi:hypothetical protein